MSEYTESDLKEAVEAAVEVAVAEALAPYREEAALDNLAKAFEDAKAPLVEQVKTLQDELDSTTLRAAKAESEYTALVTMLETAKAEQDEAAAIAERRDARREAVKELAFTDDYVEANLDRWAAKSDEDFAELLDGWKAVVSKKDDGSEGASSIPATTAMKASREDNKIVDRFADMREVSRMGLYGTDIRTL